MLNTKTLIIPALRDCFTINFERIVDLLQEVEDDDSDDDWYAKTSTLNFKPSLCYLKLLKLVYNLLFSKFFLISYFFIQFNLLVFKFTKEILLFM